MRQPVTATFFFKSPAWYSARVRESYVYLAVMGATAWRGFLILSVSAPRTGCGRAEGLLRGRNTALCGIRREKRDEVLGERHREAKGNPDGGTGSSRGREIGIGKNKAQESSRERERHAKQVPKRVSHISIFLWSPPLPRLLMMMLTPACGSWSRWNCGYTRDARTYFLLVFFFVPWQRNETTATDETRIRYGWKVRQTGGFVEKELLFKICVTCAIKKIWH